VAAVVVVRTLAGLERLPQPGAQEMRGGHLARTRGLMMRSYSAGRSHVETTASSFGGGGPSRRVDRCSRHARAGDILTVSDSQGAMLMIVRSA
jgi:hypothetical protein